MLMVKHVMPMMVEAGGGSICNTSPGSSLSGYLFLSAYASSKLAINTLTKYVSTQSGKINIRCNVVSPGPILTQTARDNAAPGQFATYENHSLTPFLGDHMHIASAVVFLASDNARFHTGQVIVVEGGYTEPFPHVAKQREAFTGSKQLNIRKERV